MSVPAVSAPRAQGPGHRAGASPLAGRPLPLAFPTRTRPPSPPHYIASGRGRDVASRRPTSPAQPIPGASRLKGRNRGGGARVGSGGARVGSASVARPRWDAVFVSRGPCFWAAAVWAPPLCRIRVAAAQLREPPPGNLSLKCAGRPASAAVPARPKGGTAPRAGFPPFPAPGRVLSSPVRGPPPRGWAEGTGGRQAELLLGRPGVGDTSAVCSHALTTRPAGRGVGGTARDRVGQCGTSRTAQDKEGQSGASEP